MLIFFFSETISSIPLQLEEDDIEDFCSLAQYYVSRTPQSFRKVGATAHSFALMCNFATLYIADLIQLCDVHVCGLIVMIQYIHKILI